MKVRKSSLILALLFLLGAKLSLGQWGPIVRLSETDSASYAGQFGIPLVVSGQYIHAIWNDYCAGTRCLVYRRSTDNGVNWSSLVQLTKCIPYRYFFTYSTYYAGFNLHLAYDSSGIRYRRSSDNGATWSTRDSLGRAYGNFRFAANSAGFVFVVWEDWYNDTIYAKRSTDNGANWSSPVPTAKPYSWDNDNVLIADFPPYVYFVYASHDTIFCKRSTNNGATWETTVPVVATSGLYNFIFTADNRNRLHLAWTDNHTGNPEVYYIRSTNNGASWSGTTRLTISNGTSMYWIGAKDDIVYLTYYNYSTYKTRRRSFDGGATWEDESDWPTSYTPYYLQIALGEANRVHLAALHYTYPTGYSIAYFRSKNSGTTWPDSAIPISNTDNLYRYPRAIALAGGNVHVLWEDYQYGNYEIFYRRGVGLAGLEESENLTSHSLNNTVLTAHPNPFKSQTAIRFTLPAETKVSLKIYDISGKLVKSFPTNHQTLTPNHCFIWDGTDDFGRKLPAGIYLLRLRASDGATEIKEFIILR
jgi:hypothetical protein